MEFAYKVEPFTCSSCTEPHKGVKVIIAFASGEISEIEFGMPVEAARDFAEDFFKAVLAAESK